MKFWNNFRNVKISGLMVTILFGLAYLAISIIPLKIKASAVSVPMPVPSRFPGSKEVEIPNPLSQVDAPCLKDFEVGSARLDLKPCSKVFVNEYQCSKTASLSPMGADRKLDGAAAQKYPPIVSLLRQYFNYWQSCYYQGYLPAKYDPSSVSAENPSAVQIKSQCSEGTPLSSIVAQPLSPSSVPVCSINDGEVSSNGYGASCGSPGSAVKGNNPEWEGAQTRGLWIQAVKYYVDQVINQEMIRDHILKIHPACSSMAQDYYVHLKTARAYSDNLVQGKQAVDPSSYVDVDFCSSSPTAFPVLQDGRSLADIFPKTSVCYLSTARNQLTALFMAVAKCEVFARVDVFFAKAQADSLSGTTNLAGQCATRGSDAGTAAKSEDAGKQEFDRCYWQGIQDFFRKIVNENIPGRFDCKDSTRSARDREVA